MGADGVGQEEQERAAADGGQLEEVLIDAEASRPGGRRRGRPGRRGSTSGGTSRGRAPSVASGRRRWRTNGIDRALPTVKKLWTAPAGRLGFAVEAAEALVGHDGAPAMGDDLERGAGASAGARRRW